MYALSAPCSIWSRSSEDGPECGCLSSATSMRTSVFQKYQRRYFLSQCFVTRVIFTSRRPKLASPTGGERWRFLSRHLPGETARPATTSDTPRERAYRLATGSTSASTVIVSFLLHRGFALSFPRIRIYYTSIRVLGYRARHPSNWWQRWSWRMCWSYRCVIRALATLQEELSLHSSNRCALSGDRPRGIGVNC